MPDQKQYRIRVYGRVQGVGFRYASAREARRLGLRGWVKNESNGTVLALIQGEEEPCVSFISWCRRGSGYGWVEKLDISEIQVIDSSSAPLSPFRIIY